METVKETLTIQTPEHVGFQYALAGVGTRSMAFLVDTVIRGLLILSVFVVFMLISKWFPALSPAVFADLPMNWIIAVGVLAYGVLDLGYFLIFEAMWSGQTPGKRFQKLRAIRIDGQPLGWIESAIRNILRAVDMVSGFYPLGLIVIFLSPRSQRIGDYAAGTVVIIERRRRVPGNRTRLRTSIKFQIPDIEVHLSTLEPGQYRILSSFLERRQQMDQSNRHELARDLACRLTERWGLVISKDVSHESFLEEVVGAYERSRRAI